MRNHKRVRFRERIRRVTGVRFNGLLKIPRLMIVSVGLFGVCNAMAIQENSSPGDRKEKDFPSSIIVDSLILPYSFKLSLESPRFFPEKDSGAKVRMVVNTREPIPSFRIAARATVVNAGAAAVIGPAEFQNDGFNTYSFRWGGKDRHGKYVPEGPYQIAVEVRCDSSMVFMNYPVQALYEKAGAGAPDGCGRGFYLALLVPMVVRMRKARR
jgi:hypothetical protein